MRLLDAPARGGDLQFEWCDGHVVLDDNGTRVLVDTGSPRSVGSLPAWRFHGVPVPLDAEAQGVTVARLSEYIGTRIDVLLGLDFLGTRSFQIDMAQREFRMLRPDETLPAGRTIPLKIVGGLPTVAVVLGRHEIRAMLDTGAKISYLTHDLISNYTTVGRVRDYHPTAGTFQSDIRLVSTLLGSAKATLRCGTLPPILEAGLRVSGIRGIVGSDLLEQYVVTFVMPRQLILS